MSDKKGAVATTAKGTKKDMNPDEFAQDGSSSLFCNKPWYAMGSMIKGKTRGQRYLNDNAVRARAGLLNFTAVAAFTVLMTSDNPNFLMYTLAPVVFWDMLSAALFGLTPLSPYGVLGTILSWRMHPVWKPAEPKRFAWFLGTIMVATCVLFGTFKVREGVLVSVSMCFVLTWLEAVLGFCLGCYLWNNVLVRFTSKEKCVECTIELPMAGTAPTPSTDTIEAIVRAYPIVVFSKTKCPHCRRAKGLLRDLGVLYKEITLDLIPEGANYIAALIELTGQRTVPNIYIAGSSIGGADDTFKLHEEGKLLPMIVDSGASFEPKPKPDVESEVVTVEPPTSKAAPVPPAPAKEVTPGVAPACAPGDVTVVVGQGLSSGEAKEGPSAVVTGSSADLEA